MALIKCHECGNQVSTDAKTCPQCGAKIRKRHSKGQWLLIGLATVGIVSCIAKTQGNTDRRTNELSAAEAKKSPEQKTAEAAEKLKKEAEFQRVVAGAKVIKQGTKNPDSFNLNSATLMADGSICYEYRATNSFNAVVPGKLVITKNNKTTQKGRDWNKFCGGKTGTDYSHARQAI